MPSRYPLFDRSRLRLRPLAEREHDYGLADLAGLDPVPATLPQVREIAGALAEARNRGAARILMMGAHALRSGVQRHLADLLRRGWPTLVAVNGAAAVHDYEMARIGATTENVARYIAKGQFGLWSETGAINQVAVRAAAEGLGLGEALGRHILEQNLPHADISVFAQAYRHGIPVTVHVALGQDIVHEHPDCDGAAVGQASYTDFLIFAREVENLEHGALLSLGSAVMGPEVFLKALAMARNVDPGRKPRSFTTLVSDLHPLPPEPAAEAPKSEPGYYFRPWKTLLVRTVATGGRGLYVQGRHSEVIPQLWSALCGLQP